MRFCVGSSVPISAFDFLLKFVDFVAQKRFGLLMPHRSATHWLVKFLSNSLPNGLRKSQIDGKKLESRTQFSMSRYIDREIPGINRKREDVLF